MRLRPLPVVLLAACAALTGCSREITRQQVAEFIDQADAAARKSTPVDRCLDAGSRGYQFPPKN